MSCWNGGCLSALRLHFDNHHVDTRLRSLITARIRRLLHLTWALDIQLQLVTICIVHSMSTLLATKQSRLGNTAVTWTRSDDLACSHSL